MIKLLKTSDKKILKATKQIRHGQKDKDKKYSKFLI